MKGERTAKSDITKRPKRKGRDISHTLARAGISSIPVVGGPANELLSLVITPSLEKRRDKWIESIAEGLRKLEEKVEGFKIENLCENESFISTAMQASQVAIRNHQKEKLEALRNAVLNAALASYPKEDLRFMFLAFVDFLTPWHIKALRICKDKDRIMNNHQAGKKTSPADELPEPVSGVDRNFYDQVARDLYSRGLFSMLTGSDAPLNFANFRCWGRITDLGRKFLEFITSPIERQDNNSGAEEESQ